MSKPYTEAILSDQLAQDRSWRLKEISDLKDAIDKADANLQRVLLRALVTICYAHWEGYVKNSARRYFQFIALRRHPFRELDPQFIRNYFLPRLGALATSKTSISQRCDLIDEILSASEKRFVRLNDGLVETRSNLNYDVLTDLCIVCGVPASIFEDKSTFVDVILLKRRNEIAHGEDTFVGIDDLDRITTDTIGLMRIFGDALENQIYLGKYRATQAVDALI